MTCVYSSNSDLMTHLQTLEMVKSLVEIVCRYHSVGNIHGNISSKTVMTRMNDQQVDLVQFLLSLWVCGKVVKSNDKLKGL